MLLNQCPICQGHSFEHLHNCIDHTVSRETFAIQRCHDCAFTFTNPRPSPSEIGKYYKSEDYISHSSTRSGLINNLYHFARKFTLANKLSLVKSLHLANKTVLDIGSGTGEFLNVLNCNGFDAKGIEPDNDARLRSIKKYKLDVSDSLQLFQLEAVSIGLVTMWHVIEHVHDLDEYFAQIYKILVSNGTLIMAVPNCDSYDCKKYGKDWAAYDVPRHLSHFNTSTMNRMLQKHGFTLVKTKPMPLDGFYVSMLTEKNRGNGSVLSLVKGSWTGLITLISGIFSVSASSSIIFICKKN